MTKDPGDTFVAYTDAQIITATSTFAAAAARIRNETLDDDFPDRLAHAVMLLGTRSLLARYGQDAEAMTVTRFKELIIKEFQVTEKSVDNDLKYLKGENIIELQSGVLEDGRTKVVTLTEVGEILYRLIGQRTANLILATAELLTADGAVPARPRDEVADAISDYAVLVRRVNKSK